jgi:recombination protein RecT
MNENPLTPSTRQKTPIEILRDALQRPSIQSKIKEVLNDRAPQFASALVQLVAGSQQLQRCDPNTVIAAAMTAAILDLPIDKNLGFAHIIPYGNSAQFQLGVKAFVQLAIRTGQYKHLNATEIYKGELISFNRLTGEAVFNFDKKESDEVVGYAAFFELVTGYQQTVYWTKEDVLSHAKKFSAAYKAGKKDSPWFTNFDAMGCKTVLKDLLSHWGILSVQLQRALIEDQGVKKTIDAEAEYVDNKNSAPSAPEHTLVEAEVVTENVDDSNPDLNPSASKEKPQEKPVAQAESKPAATSAPSAASEPADPEHDKLSAQIAELAKGSAVTEAQIVTYCKGKGVKLCASTASSLKDFVPARMKVLVENWSHVVDKIKAQ